MLRVSDQNIYRNIVRSDQYLRVKDHIHVVQDADQKFNIDTIHLDHHLDPTAGDLKLITVREILITHLIIIDHITNTGDITIWVGHQLVIGPVTKEDEVYADEEDV